MSEDQLEQAPETAAIKQYPFYYQIRFREDGMFTSAGSELGELARGAEVMVATDHGQEPAVIMGYSPLQGCLGQEKGLSPGIVVERLLASEEAEKYRNLGADEKQAFRVCQSLISKHGLQMNLVRVERFFDGSKMIFYFTAENRVDFRALVKDLVHEFRTRVEMRQVGVRHETKMIGGIGTCGRELCCASFIRNFESVSIKMAKEQDLPLNPTKISGVCNRLLCCLTYEFETYKRQRKHMPKPGRHILINGVDYLVKRQIPLQDAVIVETAGGDEKKLTKQEWRGFQPAKKDSGEKRGDHDHQKSTNDE